MHTARPLAVLTFMAAASLANVAWATSHDEHKDHHPAAAVATPATAAAPTPAAGMANMPGHTAQMKAMQDMHAKMMSAKTPEERQALMGEHMKLMQGGMVMMGRMGSSANQQGMQADMAARQGSMEQRMDMMQSMMQMMMDRLPPAPAPK